MKKTNIVRSENNPVFINGGVQKLISDAAKAFESKLNKEEMDIQFTFNEDWSNLPDLIKEIKDKLKSLSNWILCV